MMSPWQHQENVDALLDIITELLLWSAFQLVLQKEVSRVRNQEKIHFQGKGGVPLKKERMAQSVPVSGHCKGSG